MNLKRQLLLVSVLTLVLPWAGYQFIRETESALRAGQQQMLAGTARAIADSLAQYREEFPDPAGSDYTVGDQLYGHRLETRPEIDGYFDDWTIERESLQILRGVDGPVSFAVGVFDQAVYLYVEVTDRNVIFAQPGATTPDNGSRYSDRVSLINTSPLYLDEMISFSAEAPGQIVTVVQSEYAIRLDREILAYWQDVPYGYQIEARIPVSKLGTHLGIVVSNTAGELESPVHSVSFAAPTPGPFVTPSPKLIEITANLAQRGTRLFVTDASGWRIAASGDLSAPSSPPGGAGSAWLRIAYDALVESGQEPALAEPDPSGREQQDYIAQALDGSESDSWFRSADSGKAVVAVAEPIKVNNTIIGAIVLQQGTEAILSLTNQGLVRLMNVTIIATLLVAATLLGYATWLSRRIQKLSVAAEEALDADKLRSTLPSASAGDEVGDLSRSFSHVLRQLADYNDYLRSLASKLSHELRTPLAIVTSSLENLDHEPLNEASQGYAARARDGADRLRRILTAMSEASRVEELMEHAEPENFELCAALTTTVAAYRDVYPDRSFRLDTDPDTTMLRGSPELIIQMLDKLVDNAVDFSAKDDTIVISLRSAEGARLLTVSNPGPPLPEQMRSQLFDSMVSVRRGGDDKHLGLGLYVAKLIAEGHRGTIEATNSEGGVTVTVTLPGDTNGE
ncbi:MAG: ATP-binding protein [Gammaproteobacteria bacterium]|nr:ATP-binding protein [Gammaproteobacteria bacterium]MDH3409049.1 ATP-binding protein [Gammaproteobacteria bacterium]MDH3553473.1 ATP-binding protein [Gammaproteobacteria bacterium]